MFIKTFKSWPIVLLTICFIVLFKLLGLTQALDRQLYDYFLHFKSAPPPDDITLIAIDEKSINALGKWPWARDAHVQLLRQLQRHNPQLIAFDILFIEPDADVALDKELIDVVQEMANVVLPVYIGSLGLRKNTSSVFSRVPYTDLSVAAAALGHVQMYPDVDGIGRSVYLKQGVKKNGQEQKIWPHFSLAANDFIYKKNKIKPKENRQLLKRLQKDVQIIKEEKYYVPFIGPAGSFNTVSYIDVLLGKVSTGDLENKIFFVGATAAGLGDDIATPITGEDRPMSGVEGHANIFQAIRTNTLIKWLPNLSVTWISILICALLAIIGIWISARAILVFCFFAFTAVLFINYFLLMVFDIWLPSASLLVGLIVLYPLWSFYGLSQTIQFLRDELSRVENAPSFFSQPQELVEFETGLNSFLMAGLVSSWWISDEDNTRLLTAGSMPYDYDSKLISEGEFEVNKKAYRWACAWFETVHKEEYSELLEIKKVFKITAKKGMDNEEFLSASIEHLRFANQQSRVIYNMVRETLQNMQGSILILDKAGRILFANDNAKKLYALAEITVENNHIFYCMNELFDQDQEMISLLRCMLFESKEIYTEVKFKNDKHYLLQANKLKLMHTQEIALVSMTDITSMKKLQAARAEALQFLSHDLRSPMVSILALLDQAKDDGEIKPETLESCARLARKNLGYANNYLQIVRAEEGAMNADLVDAVGVFDTAIANIYAQSKRLKIEIRINWPDEVLWVKANINLLSRALQNLLDNAIKYSPAGSVVNASIIELSERIGFCVEDQGMGIPEKDQTDLFKSFKRASNAKESNIEGTGLGLRFVEVVSERHGGSIEVKSIENEGSKFILWLPKAQEYVE